LSAYWHHHCIPTCTFIIPCKHTGNSIVFLSVHSTFLVSILTLSLYSFLYIQHSLSAYWHYHCIPTCTFNIPCQHTDTYHCIPTCTFNIPCQHTDTRIVFLPVHLTFLVSILTLIIVFLPVHLTFLVSILTLELYSYLYIQHSLSAYWHYHCIPTCTFNIPCQHTDTRIVFLPVHSTFLVSILKLELYSYLYVPHSLSAYWVNIIMCRRSITTDFIWSSFTPRRRANIVNVSLPVIWSIKASNWGQYPRFLWTCYK